MYAGYPSWAFKAFLTSCYDNWKVTQEKATNYAQKMILEGEGKDSMGSDNVASMNRQGYFQSRPQMITIDEFAKKNNIIPERIVIKGIPQSMNNNYGVRNTSINTDISESFKSRLLLSREGLRTNDEILAKDVKTIMDTGYFSDVSVTTSDKKPLTESDEKYETLSKLGVVDHVRKVDEITFDLKERKTGHILKKFEVRGVFQELDYGDIEDQILGKFKGKEITGTIYCMSLSYAVV